MSGNRHPTNRRKNHSRRKIQTVAIVESHIESFCWCDSFKVITPEDAEDSNHLEVIESGNN